jgi:5'(3')-deoxyribonucleotidase
MQKQIIEPNEKIKKNILLLDINLINDNVLKALWDFFETESIYYFVAYYNLEEKRFVDVNIHYESSIDLLDLFFERS